MAALDTVKLSRLVQRPTAQDFIESIFTDFIDLHGDRQFADDQAVIGGLAFFHGRPVTVVGTQKGKNVEENLARNFGLAHPEGYRKALRLMKQAEKFHRPVICFINTSGAASDASAEERGQGEAIAHNLAVMSQLRTPVISILIGEGGSGGALALAVADRVWMLENASYSILSPEGFASILWKDSSRAAEAAEVMKLTARELLAMGVIERVIPEAEGGAQNGITVSAEAIDAALAEELKMLDFISDDERLRLRYERFRKFGEYGE